MSSTIITGKGKRRRRDNELWSSDDESPEVTIQRVERKSVYDSNSVENLQVKQSEKDNKEENETSIDQLRVQSRNEYLKKRQESKLAELSQELAEFELKLDILTPSERKDYETKSKIYKTIKDRVEHKTDTEEYQMPSDYVRSDGKVDNKRKYDLLKRSQIYDEPETTKKNKYENQWERDQLNKANQISLKTDEISLPNQKEYEFVFDESQFVNFDGEEIIEGDDSNSNEQTSLMDYNNLQECRKSLPVYKYRDEFLEAVDKSQVLIIVGETGSGKTTQLPQYLYEAGYSRGKDGKKLKIACTQPRRVAATSVATRVSEEMGSTVGEKVGYSIRFEDRSSLDTVIKYLTDGMLLREFLNDPELSGYSSIIIDEAHERTLSTEIILSLLKDLVKSRSDLKLIVASATINAKKFSDYFNNAPIFNIPGRRFPVDVHYTKNPEANYIQAAITTIFQIHTTQESGGDILVFLTGQEEIELMEESLNEAVEKLGTSIKPLIICSIYANLPTDMQQKIFEPTPPDSRKVVLATNIAETSITIDGIKYVIDPGYVKQNVFNPVTGMESLVVVPCSRASANQRAGRAGRVGPGKCFRLYTKWSFYNELESNPTPEILRVNLTSTILLLLSLGITDLVHFEFMDPPSPETIIKALELLYSLGALNSKGQLTRLGRKMTEFPIDPMFSKCLMTSSKLGVVQEILSIIATLGESSNLFYRPKDKKEQSDKKKEGFYSDQGDHLSYLNIWEQWVENGYSNQWCEDNFLQYRTLKKIKDIRNQLERLCERTSILYESESGTEVNHELKIVNIQKSIVSGFFPNIVRLSKMGDSYQKLKKNQSVYVHPSSSLFSIKPPPKLLLYQELVLTSKEFMRNCMIVNEEWVSEYGCHYYSKKDLEMIKPKVGLNRYKK